MRRFPDFLDATARPLTGTTNYTLDALYRLAQVDAPNAANDEAFRYDRLGNRMNHTRGSVTVADNARAQTWWNRAGHYLMLCFITPGAALSLLLWASVWLLEGLSRNTLVMSILGEAMLIGMMVIGYGYYVPKGYRRYFYIVCATPAIVGLLLSLACIAMALHSGVSPER
jgi:hypothetical protein